MAQSVYIGWLGPIQFQADASGIIFPGTVTGTRFLGDDGTAAAPTFSFSGTGDGDNGMYLSAADTLGFSAGGTLRLSVSGTAVTSTVPYVGPVGSAAAVSYGFTGALGDGLYFSSVPRMSVGGVQSYTFGATSFTTENAVAAWRIRNDSAALSFGAGDDVSLSRGAANRLDLALNDSFNVKGGTGAYMFNDVAGFTGTGAYTNFTIAGGIITAAS